jgi:hypothetical protein
MEDGKARRQARVRHVFLRRGRCGRGGRGVEVGWDEGGGRGGSHGRADRATGGEATTAEVFKYQICSPLHSF